MCRERLCGARGGMAQLPGEEGSGKSALCAIPRRQRRAGSAPVAVKLGSTGGTGLNGGAISLGLSGDTITAGANATGLILQSIGAGGAR